MMQSVKRDKKGYKDVHKALGKWMLLQEQKNVMKRENKELLQGLQSEAIQKGKLIKRVVKVKGRRSKNKIYTRLLISCLVVICFLYSINII